MNKSILFALMAAAALPAVAQVKVQNSDGTRVTVGNGVSVDVDARNVSNIATDGNTSSVTVGTIEKGANVQGVTVINGKVWIDGEEVPPGVTRYKAKSGKVYRIERKNGNVSVAGE